MRLIHRLFPVLALCWLAAGTACAETLAYPDLVDRLTNLEHLAVPPAVGEATALASSYDRASQYDAAHDQYIHWDANGDGTGIIRRIGKQEELAVISGPGCIYRTWSALARDGHVRIYLDGAKTPAVDLPFKSYFDGKTAPFNRPHLVYSASTGLDNFTPIPFQKSCKIIADKGWGWYYHFNYVRFPAGTVVPTFSMNLSAVDAAALDRADNVMAHCGQNPAGARAGEKTETLDVTVPAGGTATVLDLRGAQAITALQLKLDLPHNVEAQRTLLRQLTVQITWDDEKAPAVWSPLGDFFGVAAGANPYLSLPSGLTKGGRWYSYWYMPFANRAHIEVGNDSNKPVTMSWQVSHAPLTAPADALLRFHAKWHRDAFLPQRKDRAIDWTILTTQGRGRFVGTLLHVWNPRGGWWGEGDEKFFVDGEKFPSTFGTGSEDYFGYAWGNAGLFSRPFHDQPLNEGNRGHVSDDRWHIADDVPFQTSFEGCIEKYFSNDRPTLYAAVGYWYLAPGAGAGGTDPYPVVPVGQRIGYWVRPRLYRVSGAIEGESMKVLQKPQHAPSTQPMWSFGTGIWSGESQLLWRPKDAGEKIELQLPVKKSGHQHLLARFTKAPDYGIFQLSLNGQKLGSPIDLYGPSVSGADPIDLGVLDLDANQDYTLTVELVGKNPDSTGHLFGLDYVKLVLGDR